MNILFLSHQNNYNLLLESKFDASFGRPNVPLKEALLERVQAAGLLPSLASLVSSFERCSDAHQEATFAWASKVSGRMKQNLVLGVQIARSTKHGMIPACM